MEEVVLVVVAHIEFVDSLEIELVQNGNAVIGATGFLSLNIVGKSLSRKKPLK